MIATEPDTLRLLALPVLAWAAWSDHHTRRVDRRVWAMLIIIGSIAAVWQVDQLAPIYTTEDFRTLTQLIIVPPATGFLAVILYRAGAFGGADAKALFALGLVFPTPVEYVLPALSIQLPIYQPQIMLIAVGFNGMLFAVLLYLLKMWAQNLKRGERTVELLVTEEIAVSKIPETPGQMNWTDETGELHTLDLDALRMYFRWKNTTVSDIRQHPNEHRSTGKLEAIYEIDDGVIHSEITSNHPLASEDFDSHENPTVADRDVTVNEDDAWGAQTFLDSITHTAYGTTTEELSGGLEHILTTQSIRVQPAFPLIVPLFLGVVTAVTIGDIIAILATSI